MSRVRKVYMADLDREGRVEEEAGPLITTVDPADIRGLVTTLVFPSSACLGLESRVGLGRLVTPSRVAPLRGRASSPTLPWSREMEITP
jgi:hypothetical protein